MNYSPPSMPTPTADGNVPFAVEDDVEDDPIDDLIRGMEEQITSTRRAILTMTGDDAMFNELMKEIDDGTPVKKLEVLSHIHTSLVTYLSSQVPQSLVPPEDELWMISVTRTLSP